MRTIISTVIHLVFAVSVASVIAACEMGESIAVPYSIGTDGTGGDDSADAGPDAANDGPTSSGGDSGCDFLCPGDCVPSRPAGFSSPRLVWFGADESAAPPCPSDAAEQETIVHADPSVPAASCSECSCAPSTGSCELPTTITAHSALCNDLDGSLAIDTDPPLSWTGECSADNAIPAGVTCFGLPCVESVTFGALTITDESCSSSGTSTTPLPPPFWQLSAKICEGSAFGQCDTNQQCAPAQTEGFSQCVEQTGDVACPSEGYTERHVYFDGLLDTRQCSPCGCGFPEGSFCTAEVSLFADSACTGPILSANAWSGWPTCHDMGPPVASIGAKSASEPVYTAGICQAVGGEFSGQVTPTGPRTLCCLP